MEKYKHGVGTHRDSDAVPSTLSAAYNVQLAIGTAPINQLKEPGKAVNVPLLVKSKSEAKELLGSSNDYKNYTLMQVAYASFVKMGVAPVIFINVLDPDNPRHVEAVAEQELVLTKGSATIEDDGILIDEVVVSLDGTTAQKDKDYVATFNSDFHVVISVTPDGALKDATKVKVAYTKLNPNGVTAEDIIGGIDETGKRTGIELIDEVFTRLNGQFGGVLIAPEYSSNPAVAAALEAKAELAGGLTNAFAIVDLDTEQTRLPSQVADAKKKIGVESRWTVAVWPKVLMNGYCMAFSSAFGALCQYMAVKNGGVPGESPDNNLLGIGGIVLEDGTEVHMLPDEVNDYINAFGVVSAVYINGWKAWGNNTTIYDNEAKTENMTKPNNRFIKNVMMCNYLENRFKLEALSRIGKNANTKLVDSVVTDFNKTISALVPNYMAGGEIIFDKDKTTKEELMQGHLYFKTRYADWTPTEYIEHDFFWSADILEEALLGGSE